MNKKLGAITSAIILATSTSGFAFDNGGRSAGINGNDYPGPDQYKYRQYRQSGPAPHPLRASEGRDAQRHEELMNALPDNIRDKITGSEQLKIDIKSEMGKMPLNKEKITQLRNEQKHLQMEVSDWFFAQMLESIENAQRSYTLKG